MSTEPLTPENTTIILVDHAVGFANVLRSHDVATHLNNVVGLAETAVGYETGLVVTNGMPSHPAGPLYPGLLDVIGDRPVIGRPPGHFNAFLEEDFARAVRNAGREKIVVAGVSTEGCVLQTALGGQREGYDVHVVVDASASLTPESHATAVQRMVQAGVVPVTWFALASEFSIYEGRPEKANVRQRLMAEHVPEMALGVLQIKAAQERARLAPAAG